MSRHWEGVRLHVDIVRSVVQLQSVCLSIFSLSRTLATCQRWGFPGAPRHAVISSPLPHSSSHSILLFHTVGERSEKTLNRNRPELADRHLTGALKFNGEANAGARSQIIHPNVTEVSVLLVFWQTNPEHALVWETVAVVKTREGQPGWKMQHAMAVPLCTPRYLCVRRFSRYGRDLDLIF